jgi:SAM-dependent methyltransferase
MSKKRNSNTNVKLFFDGIAFERDKWKSRNSYYHSVHLKYLKFIIPDDKRVLDLGCSTGKLLNGLKPSYGLGIDISSNMVEQAKQNYPHLEWLVGDIEESVVYKSIKGPFDYIVLSGTIGYLKDCQMLFSRLHSLCDCNTRIIICYYSWFWDPILSLAETVHLKMPHIEKNWLSSNGISHILKLADFDIVKKDKKILIPHWLLGLEYLINRFIATLPLIRRCCLMNYLVARSLLCKRPDDPSVSIIIPCKNESGNIEPAVTRLPRFCDNMEIIFVEGGSKDNTVAEIERVILKFPEYDIKRISQSGNGKRSAVSQGFDHARGEILMILDADLTTPPEDLPKFYQAITTNKGEFILGTRMVYPQEIGAMRGLNRLANTFFSVLFTFLLNGKYTDTLCGTKVLTREHLKCINKECGYFVDFDPFGDFYLIFGAYKINLKAVEIPIRYRAREYGVTQISRFRHGMLLFKMAGFAYRKLKAV